MSAQAQETAAARYAFIKAQRQRIIVDQKKRIDESEDSLAVLISLKVEFQRLLQWNIDRKVVLETTLAEDKTDLNAVQEAKYELHEQEEQQRVIKELRRNIFDYELEIKKREKRIKQYTEKLIQINSEKNTAEKALEQETKVLQSLQISLERAAQDPKRKAEILQSLQAAVEKAKLILQKKEKSFQFLQVALKQAAQTGVPKQQALELTQKQESVQNKTELAQKLNDTHVKLNKAREHLAQTQIRFEFFRQKQTNNQWMDTIHTRIQRAEEKIEQHQEKLNNALSALSQTPTLKLD